MTDSLLTPQDREEALSRSYAYVIAKLAGYITSEYDFDRDGFDFRIQAGGNMRPAIDLQLKATINLGNPRDGYFRYPLMVRNYDLLRIERRPLAY